MKWWFSKDAGLANIDIDLHFHLIAGMDGYEGPQQTYPRISSAPGWFKFSVVIYIMNTNLAILAVVLKPLPYELTQRGKKS